MTRLWNKKYTISKKDHNCTFCNRALKKGAYKWTLRWLNERGTRWRGLHMCTKCFKEQFDDAYQAETNSIGNFTIKT